MWLRIVRFPGPIGGTFETVTSDRIPLPGAFASTLPTSTYKGPRGTFYLYQVAPYVVYTQAVGHMDHGCAEAFMAFVNRTFDRGRTTTLFHDWSGITGYDSDARATLTRWTIERRSVIGSVSVLVKSKLLSMGIATANLATMPMGVTFHSHTDRAVFEREFLAAMK